MIWHVALLRGINVGPSKRIAMNDLQALVERLGYEDVRTILNTGNIVFRGKKAAEATTAERIREAIERRHGFVTHTIVMPGTELDAIIREAPLVSVADNPSRHLVAFTMDKALLATARKLASQDWGAERLAVTARAAYVWSPKGVLASQSLEALSKLAKDTITTRNWSTVLKIQAAMRDE
jgi:uncharacterized protein (DUF1697 family)